MLFFVWLGATGALAVLAIVWAVRAFLWWRRRSDKDARHSPRWFVAAPLAGVLALGAAWTDLPLRTRWALAKDDFARQLPAALADSTYRDIRPHRLGTYNIVAIDRNLDAVIFTEATGDLFDDAGFAYLPNGPHRELANGSFENPQFVSLGGHWYSWTASW